MSNTTAEKKKLQGVFALWRKKSQDGKTTYFSGQTEDKSSYLTAFYNTNKKNLKEPDLRVYKRDADGNLEKEPFVSLWANATKNGKGKYLSGKIDGKRVIGFIREDASEKHPYISVYFSDDQEQKKEAKTEEKKPPKYKKKEAPKYEEIETDSDLPF